MRNGLIRWTLVFATCAYLGCGSASGVKPGIPEDLTAAPINPTPDMETGAKKVKN